MKYPKEQALRPLSTLASVSQLAGKNKPACKIIISVVSTLFLLAGSTVLCEGPHKGWPHWQFHHVQSVALPASLPHTSHQAGPAEVWGAHRLWFCVPPVPRPNGRTAGLAWDCPIQCMHDRMANVTVSYQCYEYRDGRNIRLEYPKVFVKLKLLCRSCILLYMWYIQLTEMATGYF